MSLVHRSEAKRLPLAEHLRQFRSVLAVCQSGSTAQAAALLPLSQSAIARAIRELEISLGLQLFERAARGMSPTHEGRLLAHRAERAIQQLLLAEREALSLVESTTQITRKHTPRLADSCAYRHLRTYIAFCETRGEVAAAASLGVSQPAVSQTLRQLEHMVGIKMFHRSVRGVRLSESGEAVLRRAKLALAEFRHAEEDLAALHGKMQGRIVIGSLPLSAGVLVPRAVDRMLDLHKDLSVTIVDGTYEALMHQLRHADVDIIVGALRDKLPSSDVKQEALFDDTLSVVVRHGHPLIGVPLAGLQDLLQQSWIAPLTGTPAREAFERAFVADGVVAPRASLEVNSPVVLQALLLDSDRLAMLSRRQVIRGISAGLFSVLPVDVKQTHRHIGLTMRSDADPSASMRVFMDEIKRLSAD